MSQDKPQGKRGPKPGPKLGEKVVEGYVVGRNKVIIPPEEVEKLAAFGMKTTEIADWFGVPESTLRGNFRDIILKGKTKLKMSLRIAMYKNAIDSNNTTMQIWLSKNHLGMSDTPMDGDANAPLPWNEYEEEDTVIEEYDEEQDEDRLE